eukprot:g4734.t1
MDSDSKSYLKSHNIDLYLTDLITALLVNRPHEPIAFISQYFQNVIRPGGTVAMQKAYQYLRMSRHSTETYLDNLSHSYLALEEASSVSVRGKAVNELLTLLGKDVPFELGPQLCEKLFLPPLHFVSYQEYTCRVNSFLLQEEVLKRAEGIFSLLASAIEMKELSNSNSTVSVEGEQEEEEEKAKNGEGEFKTIPIQLLSPLLQRALPDVDVQEMLKNAVLGDDEINLKQLLSCCLENK